MRGHYRLQTGSILFSTIERGKYLVINTADGTLKDVRVSHSLTMVIAKELKVDLASVMSARITQRAAMFDSAIRQMPTITPVQVSTHLRYATMFLIG